MRQIICKDTGEVVNTYKEYLKTKHWRNIQIRCYGFARNSCQVCDKYQRQLFIHHKHYETLGNEIPKEDLLVLCDECHKFIHAKLIEKRERTQRWKDGTLFDNS